ADREHPEWDNRLGNLTIKLQHTKEGVGRAIEIDTYAIKEVHLLPGAMGRVFLVLNITDPEQSEPYQVLIGRESLCDCKAGKCKVPEGPGTMGCKHRDAVALMLEKQMLDDCD